VNRNQLVTNAYKIAWLRSLPYPDPILATYIDKMNILFSTSVIRYWPLNDDKDSITIADYSVYSDYGMPHQVSLGQPGPLDHTCALFNGTTSHINIYSTALETNFNRLEGTAMMWFRIPTSTPWNDGLLRVGLELRSDFGNALHMAKNTPINQMQAAYIAGGISRTSQYTISDYNWHHFCLTWSDSADEWRAYMDGVLGGGLPQNIGTWTGVLDTYTNIIGAYDTTPQLQWSGYLSDVLILNRPATAYEVEQCQFG
jgi:hypothetical protein